MATKNAGSKRTAQPRSDLSKLPRGALSFVEPMKALLVDRLPTGPEWIYEVKFDGYRALAIRNDGKISLMSRNAKDLSARYAEVTEALARLPIDRFILDGEIVAINAEGQSSFQVLQSYQTPGKSKPPLLYYAFDILNLDGRSLMGLPLSDRKQLLESLLQRASRTIRFSANMTGDRAAVIREMKRHGLEGVIAKLRNSRYESGRRSGAWVKYKWSLEQEFIIGGFTPPKGARTHFGAILVGYYEDGKLLFASKVGAGFDRKLLESLRHCFQKYIRQKCPFANLPERLPSGLGPAEMRTCTWLKPEIVCQIRFTEWTRDHHLRHPLFLGLREDKEPHEVIRERPV